jgi:hypothetical protein
MARTQQKDRGAGTGATSAKKQAPRKPANEILDLQRAAGNRAVAGLLTSVQRAPDVGWGNPAAVGGVSWNAAPSKVPGTNIVRYPVDGLTHGNKQAYATDYQTKDRKTGELKTVHVNAGEKARTTESAAGRAIALVPSTLKPTLPVDVMVHLHGYTGRSSDPYAGWRQQTVGKRDNVPGKKAGEATVRDVDWDQIPQQMAASGNPQLMAILPQGVGRSEFGRFQQTSYIDEVIGRLKPVVPWQDAPKDVRVVMSAHSGGGNTVTRMLGAQGGLPGAVRTIMLFEAINTSDQAAKVWTWVLAELERLAGAVSANGAAATKDKDTAIDAAPRLRAYCSAANKGYAVWHGRLKKAIEQWFAGKVLTDFSKQASQDRKGGVPQLGTYADRMKSLFQVHIDLPGSHETVVRDNLLDALKALPGTTGAGQPSGTGGTTTPPTGAKQSASTAVTPDLATLAAVVGRNEKDLTNAVFFLRHPELDGRKIKPEEKALAREWIAIRDATVRPFVAQARDAVAGAAGRDAAGDVAGRESGGSGGSVPITVPAAGDGELSEAERKKREKGVAAATQQALTGGKAEDVAALAAALPEGTTVEEWFAGHESGATFLGLSIKPSGASKVGGVHKEMAAALKKAEADLLSQYPGSTPDQVAKELEVYSLNGLRRPKKATGGSLPSYHCFGLAVDINYAGNPFVGQTGGSNKAAGDAAADVVKHATLLMTGTAANIRAAPGGGRKQSAEERAAAQWDRLDAQSEAVRAYLSLTESELAARVGDGVAGHDLAWWRDRQAKDRVEGGRGAWGGHHNAQTHGFMDLAKNLVTALTAAGLLWGGMYRTGKDIMHFDLRTGSVRQGK